MSAVALALLSLLLLSSQASGASVSQYPANAISDSRQVAPSSAAGGLADFPVGYSSLTRDKWIGLGLAVSSSLAIGTSFIITKKASGSMWMQRVECQTDMDALASRA